jgi:hypothetical protein
MPLDKLKTDTCRRDAAKRQFMGRWAKVRQWIRSKKIHNQHRDAGMRCHIGTDEPRDIIGHDAGKQTPSVAAPIIAAQPKDAKFSVDEPPGELETTLENRRRASRRQSSKRRKVRNYQHR